MNRRLVAFAAVLLSLPFLAFATVTVPNYNSQQIPGNYFQNDTLLGCTPFNVGQSTTSSIIVAAGSGFVERLCTFNNSTTAAGYVVAVDSAPSNANCFGNVCGLGLNSLSVGAVIPGTLVLPPVFSFPLTGTALTTNTPGCASVENAPARFNNGLVVTQSSATMQTVGCYRLDTGTNP